MFGQKGQIRVNGRGYSGQRQGLAGRSRRKPMDGPERAEAGIGSKERTGANGKAGVGSAVGVGVLQFRERGNELR